MWKHHGNMYILPIRIRLSLIKTGKRENCVVHICTTTKKIGFYNLSYDTVHHDKKWQLHFVRKCNFFRQEYFQWEYWYRWIIHTTSEENDADKGSDGLFFTGVWLSCIYGATSVVDNNITVTVYDLCTPLLLEPTLFLTAVSINNITGLPIYTPVTDPNFALVKVLNTSTYPWIWCHRWQ